MKGLTHFIYLLLVLLSGCSGTMEFQENSEAIPPLDAFILEQMEEGRKPGLALLAFNREGPLWSGYYGRSHSSEPWEVAEDTPFSIGSNTKLFVAVAALQLAEQGLLDLQSDVNHYLDFPVRNPQYPDQPILVEMLFTHSAGIAMNFPRIWFTKTRGDYTGDLGDFCREYLVPRGKYYSAKSYADFAPGQGFAYSNVSVTLLAHIIEEISGQSLEEYCRENIFDPLGMEHSSFRFSTFPEEQMALPHRPGWLGGFRPLALYSFPVYPAGFGVSTVEDLSRFFLMLLNEGEWQNARILSRESVHRMLEVQPGIQPEYSDRMGLIIQYKDIPEGYQLMGHTGGFTGIAALMYYDQSRDRGVILTANGSWQSQGYDRLSDPHMRSIFLRLMEEDF